MVEILIAVIGIGVAGFIWYVTSARKRHADLQAQSRHELGELRSEHDKRVDRLQRKFANFRGRGHLNFAKDLLPALDALGQALEQSTRTEDVAALREGLEMVDRELVRVLSQHGIDKICPQPGDAFDPNVHEAVTIDETTDLAPGSVAECFRPGYVHDERVLRAAAVSVVRESRKSAAPEETSMETGGGEAQAGARSPAEVSPDDEDASAEDVSSSRL